MLVLSVAVLCGGAVGGVIWYRSRPLSTAAMYRRMDPNDNVVFYIDFNTLRRSGILQRLMGSKDVEDADYRRFVEKIGFDYKEHLDSAMVEFANTGKFMLVRGQFDWRKLAAYAKEQRGSCYAMICRMPGSAPERQISFFPVQNTVMALAVSPNDNAVHRLTDQPGGPDIEMPKEPIWLSIPGPVLRSGRNLPAGTRSFTRSIEHADRVVLTLNAEDGRYAAKMEIQCTTEGEATEVAGQLRQATATLRDLIARENLKPNPADLSGVLASGEFRTEGVRAIGRWWIEDSFLDNVWSGGVN